MFCVFWALPRRNRPSIVIFGIISGKKPRNAVFWDHEVTDERIVAVAFDDNGVVQTLEHLDGDRQNIPYTRTKTPTHGNDLTFMQQLLGNLGRFNSGNGGKVTIP